MSNKHHTLGEMTLSDPHHNTNFGRRSTDHTFTPTTPNPVMTEVEKWLDIAEELARKVDAELCHLNGNDSNLDAYYMMVAIQNARNALKENNL